MMNLLSSGEIMSAGRIEDLDENIQFDNKNRNVL